MYCKLQHFVDREARMYCKLQHILHVATNFRCGHLLNRKMPLLSEIEDRLQKACLERSESYSKTIDLTKRLPLSLEPFLLEGRQRFIEGVKNCLQRTSCRADPSQADRRRSEPSRAEPAEFFHSGLIGSAVTRSWVLRCLVLGRGPRKVVPRSG